MAWLYMKGFFLFVFPNLPLIHTPLMPEAFRVWGFRITHSDVGIMVGVQDIEPEDLEIQEKRLPTNGSCLMMAPSSNLEAILNRATARNTQN